MPKRLLIIWALGFSSGLPLSLLTTTLQAWFTEVGTSVLAAGMLSLLSLPYACRMFWSPLLDHYSLFPLGRRRSWILATQILLLAGFNGLAWFSPLYSPDCMMIITIFLVFVAATQDMAIDAYRIEYLSKQEYSLGAVVALFGYRLAIMLSGGFALIMAYHIGWSLTYQITGSLIIIGVIATLFGKEPQNLSYLKQKQVKVNEIYLKQLDFQPSAIARNEGLYKKDMIESEIACKNAENSNMKSIDEGNIQYCCADKSILLVKINKFLLVIPKLVVSIYKSLKLLFFTTNKSSTNIYLLCFILLYKCGDIFTSSTSGIMIPFLMLGLDFDLATIGYINKILGSIAIIAGSLSAGIILQRYSLFWSLMIFGLLQVLVNCVFLILAMQLKNVLLFAIAVVSDNFVAGLSSTALVILLMSIVNQSFTATHFSFLVAFSSLPRIFSGPIAACIQSWVGWVGLYQLSIIFACFFIPFLLLIRAPLIKLGIFIDTKNGLPQLDQSVQRF